MHCTHVRTRTHTAYTIPIFPFYYVRYIINIVGKSKVGGIKQKNVLPIVAFLVASVALGCAIILPKTSGVFSKCAKV